MFSYLHSRLLLVVVVNLLMPLEGGGGGKGYRESGKLKQVKLLGLLIN